jgi:SpoU rRNA methylase family enzyme
MFAHFRPTALLAQLVRAATAGIPQISKSALENCTDLMELIADLKDCVGVRYSPAEGQCQLLGKAPNEEQKDANAGMGRVVTKSCVKVGDIKQLRVLGQINEEE